MIKNRQLTDEEKMQANLMFNNMGINDNMNEDTLDVDVGTDIGDLQKGIHYKEIKELKGEFADEREEYGDEIEDLNAKLAAAMKRNEGKTKEYEIAQLKAELARTKMDKEKEAKIAQLNAELERRKIEDAQKDEIALLKAELEQTKLEKAKNDEIAQLKDQLALANQTKMQKTKEGEIEQSGGGVIVIGGNPMESQIGSNPMPEGTIQRSGNPQMMNYNQQMQPNQGMIQPPANPQMMNFNQQMQPQQGIRPNPMGQLYGWWQCVGMDSRRCVGKYVVFDKNGTGFYGCISPDKNSVDERKRYDIISIYGNNIIMEWNNENGNSGSINASLYPELLQCNGENWLKKVQVSLLSGWWLCVGQDSDRCVGSYVFFTNDGKAGFFGCPWAKQDSIDPQKRYTTLSQNRMGFNIQWNNENNKSGRISCFYSKRTSMGKNKEILQVNGEDWLIKQ